jgi:hypothetical protein
MFADLRDFILENCKNPGYSSIVGQENAVKVWKVPPRFPTAFDANSSFFLYFSQNSGYYFLE